MPQNLFSNGELEISSEYTTWIPSLEYMLEDAMLMIALYVLRDEKVQSAAKRLFGWQSDTRIECYGIEEKNRNQLYAMCRKLTQRYKIIVSVFFGSTIENQLHILSE